MASPRRGAALLALLLAAQLLAPAGACCCCSSGKGCGQCPPEGGCSASTCAGTCKPIKDASKCFASASSFLRGGDSSAFFSAIRRQIDASSFIQSSYKVSSFPEHPEHSEY